MASIEGYTRMVRWEPTSLLLAPSTSHWLALDGAPLNEISTPDRSPLFLGSKPSATAAPGIMVVKATKLRPFKGSSRTCSPFTTAPTVPVWVSTWTAVASTSTISPTAPTDSLIGTLEMSLTCNAIFFSSTFLNPGCVTVTLYTPGFSSGKKNDPSELVSLVLV